MLYDVFCLHMICTMCFWVLAGWPPCHVMYNMLLPPAPAPLTNQATPPPSPPSASLPILNCLIWPAQGNPFPFSSSPPPPCRPMRPLAPPGCPPAPPPSSLCRFAAHPWFLEVTVVVDILSDLSQK